jgi:hypothetical protein
LYISTGHVCILAFACLCVLVLMHACLVGLFKCDRNHFFFLRGPKGFGGLEVSGTPVDEFQGGSEPDTSFFGRSQSPKRETGNRFPCPRKGACNRGTDGPPKPPTHTHTHTHTQHTQRKRPQLVATALCISARAKVGGEPRNPTQARFSLGATSSTDCE